MRWLRANIAAHGGDPDKIFLLGQSAGAAHVAAYTSHPQFRGEDGLGIAGALMTSGIYDPTTQPPNQFSLRVLRRFRRDAGREGSLHGGPAGHESPAAVQHQRNGSEGLPGPGFADLHGVASAKGVYPPLEYMAGHNHLTPAQCIGSSEDDLGPRIARFIAVACAAG